MTISQKLGFLKNHPELVKILNNIGWLFAERVLRIIVGLFVGVWVARYLGPERFGLLSYAQSFVSLFTAVATLGLDNIVIRELVKDETRKNELIGTAFWLRLMGACAVLIIIALVYFISDDKYTNTFVFIITGATIFQSFNVIELYFQSKVIGKYIVYANVISLLLSSIVKIFLILTDASLISFAWVFVFDSVVLAAGLVYFYILNGSNFNIHILKFKKAVAVKLLIDSWPIILSGLVLMVQARIDQVMLQKMVGSVEVGYYSVAMKLIEVFDFLPVILSSSVFPAMVKAKHTSEALYKSRFLNYYRLSFLLFLLTAIPIMIFSEKIVVLFYGEAYQPAGVLLALMAIRLFFTNTGMARGAFINNENLFMFSLITMTFGAMVNVILNYYLIPIYQGRGAIIATIISFSVTIFIIDFLYKKTRDNVKLQLIGLLTFYKLTLKNNP